MKVVVTGAAGFIGAHLTNRLLREGHEVLAIDCFSDYYSPELKKLRVNDLISGFGGKLTQLDLADLDTARNTIHAFGSNSLVHLAAQPGIRLQPSNYQRYTKDNLTSFSNVFQVALETGINNFIYASSSSVYGNSPTDTLREDATGLKPISYYGATKLANEILAQAGSTNPKMSSIGLRFFTVYGPYGRPDMAYFRLIAQALSSYKFELFGDGNVRRDFTYVGDTVNAIHSLVLKQQAGELRGNSIFNIGGGKPASMLEMISEVEKLSGKKLNYDSLPPHSVDVKSTNAGTDKLNSILGFIPTVDLSTGLESTYEWSRKKEVIDNLENWSRSVI